MAALSLHLLGALLLGIAPAAAVEWGDAPEAVRAGVAKEHPDAEVREVRKARHRSEPGYQVKLAEGEARVRLEVRADGTIRETRTEIAPEDLPGAVAAALADRIRGRRAFATVEKVVVPRGRREATTYQVEMTVDGRVFGVVVAESGSILNVD